MSTQLADEIFTVFDARRVKTPELKNVDIAVNAGVGYVKNRLPKLAELKKRAAAVEALEPEIQKLGSTAFKDEVEKIRAEGKLGHLEEQPALLNRAFAIVREAAWRSLGKRPYPVQIMGAMGLFDGYIVEMATGEGKTLTAALAASVIAWQGKPVHVITVNDYLVARDAEWNKPLYAAMGLSVGHVIHETPADRRVREYRSGVVYVTSKELVADFLRDQIMMGALRTSAQTAVGMLAGATLRSRMLVPGLFRVIVDEADSLLVDEAVTPLIISNSPNDEANAERYRKAHRLAKQLILGRDFTIDRPVRSIDLTLRGQDRLEELAATEDATGFWAGKRRREELVTQALVAQHCFHKDEHYLITPDNKIAIIDEYTGRVMADRSWRHGLHQAIEVKEEVNVTADKENLARLSFQKFFRQYPSLAGMTGTAWESAGELWGIYRRAIVRIPTNKPNIRQQLPIRMFQTSDERWTAVVERIAELHARGVPVLVGTRSVWASEEVSKRLEAKGLKHLVLNARQDAQEANIVAQAGKTGAITVATNMAGRGTDIMLAEGVRELGGLHVIATEPHTSARIDRQLFGRAARQGDPGCAQMFASVDDDLFVRHAKRVRRFWRVLGPARLIKFAQSNAERLARFNRKQVLRADEWMDQSLPF